MTEEREQNEKYYYDVHTRIFKLLGLDDFAVGEDLAVKIADRIEHARKEHPAKEWQGKGLNWASMALLDETDELVNAVIHETPERVKDELLDVIAVAIRMYNCEWEDK